MQARLGDVIDDYCVKCKRIMNHSVVSLLNDEPAKVRCRTCHGDHDYLREQVPPSKADLRKAALFKEVLDRMGRSEDTAAAANAPGTTPAEPPAPEPAPAKAKRAKARK
jgi:hypothetical protein